MKQLNKIKRAVMAFVGCVATFLPIGICLAISSPILACIAAIKVYKNKNDIIEFDITINK